MYVHFPWCLAKCPYCDFLSVAADRADIPHQAYASAVVAELERRVEVLGQRRLGSVFFGGGTPSLWQPSALGRVLAAIRARFEVAPDLEVTVECNPTSLDDGRAAALRDAGATRLSVGVQGLDADRLKFLGRLHDPQGALSAVRAAVRSGPERVSADLIFGVPGQSPRQARDEAATIADLGVTHLSAYALTIEPGTQFGQLARKGRLPLATDDAVADGYLGVEAALRERGFRHYEISNYARDGHVARHNVTVWRGGEYLGLGVGAWGTVVLDGARLRYRNGVVPERYLAAEAWTRVDPWRQHELVRELEPIPAETALSERILLGLRLAEGVDVEAQASALGVNPWPAERQSARDDLLRRGQLGRVGSGYAIPSEHWLHADAIIARLM